MTNRPTVRPLLDAINDAFHDSYDRARGAAITDGPVFVVLADSLVLFRGGTREELGFTPPLFHAIKSVAHAPLAAYVALSKLGDAPLDRTERDRLDHLRRHLVQSLRSLPEDATRELANDLRAVLTMTLAIVVARGASAKASPEALATFARTTGPLLLRLTDAATQIQLAALDACVREAVARMSDHERGALQVVVTGDHQARMRSLGMQYFQKLLREPEGSEERVAYAEGVTAEREALALVATRRLDRDVAATFFGDPKRLQRDVLGDAVRERLRVMELPAIG